MTTSSKRIPSSARPELGDELGFALYSTSLAMTKAYKPLLEPLGLTYPQYLAMLALWKDDDITVKDISARLSLDPATITPLLKRLETLGYISRRRGTEDERLVFIQLTPTGTALKQKASSVPAEIIRVMGQSTETLLQMKNGLETLRNKLS